MLTGGQTDKGESVEARQEPSAGQKSAASVRGDGRALTRAPIMPLEPRVRVEFHSKESLDRLQKATLDVLEKVGVKFPSDKAIDILGEHGAHIDRATQIVKFPPDLVMKAMASAPRSFVFGARDPSCDLLLDGRRTYSCTDGSGVEVVDWETRQRHVSTKRDLAAISRLVDYLPGLSFWWPTVSAGDHGKTAQLHELDAGWNNTVKHLQGMVMGEREARYAVEMATVVAGGGEELRRRPVLSDLIGTISPLLQDKAGIEAALVFAEAGVPICFVTMPTMGTTAPATDAGAYIVGSAEMVSATVLVQLAFPGAPVQHAMFETKADPRNGRVMTAPLNDHSPFMGTALAHHWGVPSMGGFGGTDAEAAADWQGAVEMTQALVLAAFDGCETMTGFGLRNVYTLFWPEGMLLDEDLYERVAWRLRDIAIDEEALALDVIGAVGPGGHYLGQAHTRAHMREAAIPAITQQLAADGHYRDAVEVARERAERILREYEPEPLADDKRAELTRILAAADAELRG